MESRVDWIRLGEWKSRVSYKIAKTELYLQDLPVNLDEITELQDSSVFNLQQGVREHFYLNYDLL